MHCAASDHWGLRTFVPTQLHLGHHHFSQAQVLDKLPLLDRFYSWLIDIRNPGLWLPNELKSLPFHHRALTWGVWSGMVSPNMAPAVSLLQSHLPKGRCSWGDDAPLQTLVPRSFFVANLQTIHTSSAFCYCKGVLSFSVRMYFVVV